MTALDRMRQELEAHSWPRLHCLLMVTLSTGAAFLSSVLLLFAGVDSMAARYAVSALAGYVTFLMLIRAWVVWKRQQLGEPDFDIIDAVADMDLPLPRPSGRTVEPPAFGGGRSGGGGASMAFGPPPSGASTGAARSRGGISLDLDGDDLAWILIAVAAAFAGITAVGYVVYVAPTLLAEAILDVAVAGGVYRGLQRHQSEHWTRHVIRRTVIPAAIVIASAAAVGYALQRVAPDARSIGGVRVSLMK